MSPTPGGEGEGLEVLSDEACRSLLSDATLGRIGLSVGALPVILPMTYAVLDGDILIRTGWGSKLDAAVDGQVVCFEADAYNGLYHDGWSVLVTGKAEIITDPAELERVGEIGLRPWPSSSGDHFLRIRCDLVSGRRIGVAEVERGRAQADLGRPYAASA
jgi:uncharacterized protein